MQLFTRVRVAALGGAALLLAVTGPVWGVDEQRRAAATPVTKKLQYTDADASAWYWVHQIDHEVSAGSVAERVQLQNPQRPTTLPIAYEKGEPSKVSALKFDLAGRGVPAGSTVTRFELTILEATEPGEVPTANPNQRVVQACGATTGWTDADEPELWTDQPDVSDQCAKGERKETTVGEGDAEEVRATWTFDLSTVAAKWGVVPFDNHGVLFSGVVPADAGPTETWQVNLKVPQRDDDNTPTIDEAKETADRVSATVTYVPGAATTPAGSGTGSGNVGGAPAGGAPPAEVPGGGAPPAAGDAPGAGESPDLASGSPFRPAMPWYVWLLIPAALLVSYLVRTALIDGPDNSAGTGVIDQIKRYNATRRGGPLPESKGPFARLTSGIAARRGRA